MRDCTSSRHPGTRATSNKINTPFLFIKSCLLISGIVYKIVEGGTRGGGYFTYHWIKTEAVHEQHVT